jgi:hypothetical protein
MRLLHEYDAATGEDVVLEIWAPDFPGDGPDLFGYCQRCYGPITMHERPEDSETVCSGCLTACEEASA